MFCFLLLCKMSNVFDKGCVTVGGGQRGANCAFPFIYKEREYSGCILVDADDGKPWCSTLTDQDGVHVGGQGKWGHCPASCNNDFGNYFPPSLWY